MPSQYEDDTAYVLFRLPGESTYNHWVQYSEPDVFYSLNDIATLSGYIVAPFLASAHYPIVLLHPDKKDVHDLPANTADNIDNAVRYDDTAIRVQYNKAFNEVHNDIDAGIVNKVVLSRRLSVHTERDIIPEQLFFRACALYPHSYVALWHTAATGTWLTASPELLFENEGVKCRTMALAGTMPYNESLVSGHWDDKNIEEQAVVSRFIANKLSAVATDINTSSVHTVQSGKLLHLCTDFSFHLHSSCSFVDVLSHLHPTPAVCGMPREEALRIIQAAEPDSRSYYAGYNGAINANEDAHLYVSLRCMQLSRRSAILYAGGGIMAESEEQKEWDETNRKLQTMLHLFEIQS